MMKTIAFAALIFLPGCASLVAQTPTMQYCSKVNYTRVGNQISMSAECAAPIGGTSNIPVPHL